MPNPLVLQGDCLSQLAGLPDSSVDAVVTDPPYGLSNTKPDQVADTITRWASGERDYLPDSKGFMGKAWDGFVPPPAVWDECLRVLKPGGHMLVFAGSRTQDLMGLSIRLAGFDIRDSVAWLYGSGFPKATSVLKPAHEPIIMARKPFSGSAKANAAKYGTGGLRIDDCRIGDDVATGRWPANVVLDEHAAGIIDEQSGTTKGRVGMTQHGSGTNEVYGKFARTDQSTGGMGTEDEGGASRYFYTSKASKGERPKVDGVAHPTVKPLSLMRWLVRLVTPKGGTVLDPFAGSGTTIEAALLEGLSPIGIEREDDYLPLIQARIDRSQEAS